jgi:hypothetical protein
MYRSSMAIEGNIVLRSIIVLLIISVLFLSCGANPYTKYYRPTLLGIDQSTRLQQVPPGQIKTTNSQILRGKDVLPHADIVEISMEEDSLMKQNGYQLIGESGFVGQADPKLFMLKAHAKQIRADCVVLYSQHVRTKRGQVPLRAAGCQKKNQSRTLRKYPRRCFCLL